MMGTKDRSFAALPPVTLADLVPPDSFYRHLERSLDLRFVRELVRDAYADIGRPSIDPVVFFNLQLILFFEGLRSERQLLQVVADRLSLRWYIGYDLTERLPDHSSLSRIRERLGVDVFQRFFEQVVDLCQEAGLVWGRELYFDVTKVEANAGIPSLVPRFYFDATTHVADLFGAEADDSAPPADTELPLGIVPLPIDPEGVPTAGNPPWRLLEERRLDPKRPSHRGYRRTSDFRVSPTDPDASPMWDWGTIRLGYHDHYVVDGGKRRIILAALVTPADVMESQAMRDLLWRVCFRRKIWPHHVTGDAKYGTTENIVAIEDAGIRAYVPVTDFEHRSRSRSDQGSQYTSLAFGRRLREAGLVSSMGSRGDCFDNATAESFFATLECALLARHRFPTRSAARRALFDYIEGFYNTHRRHSALGYLSPAAYERRCTSQPIATY